MTLDEIEELSISIIVETIIYRYPKLKKVD